MVVNAKTWAGDLLFHCLESHSGLGSTAGPYYRTILHPAAVLSAVGWINLSNVLEVRTERLLGSVTSVRMMIFYGLVSAM